MTRAAFCRSKVCAAISATNRALFVPSFVLFFAQITPALGEPLCEEGTFEGTPYTACAIDPAANSIELFYRTERGTLIGSFSQLSNLLEEDDKTLVLAMNGGMYHPDRRPVGLYLEAGREIAPLVLAAGPGNFGLLPNGVLCINDGRAQVTESRRFADERPTCEFATQSGPLLVEDGALHPRLLPDSSSTFLRNGIGVRPDGTVIAAISDAPVNFHRFARLFRDALGAPDALYIDGRVSKFFAAELGRADIGLPMGPIFAVVRDAD